MRIAYFVNEFPAFSQPFVLNQIAGTIARGHDVDIFARRRVAGAVTHGVVHDYAMLERTRFLHELPSGGRARAAYFLRQVRQPAVMNAPRLLLRLVHRSLRQKGYRPQEFFAAALSLCPPRCYDVIHCQFGVLARFALELRRVGVIRGPLIVAIRGYDVTQHLRNQPNFYENVFPEVDLLLPVSESMRRRLLDLGCDDARIDILRSGIDTGKFVWRERVLRATDTLDVLSVARLVEKKGLVYALAAIAELRQRGIRLHYRIVGDGPLREALLQTIEQLGLSDCVELLGALPHEQVVQLMDNAHVLLAPSVTAPDGDQEGIPNVIKEAMAIGLPVVSTRHSGIPELITDGTTGLLVEERDSAAIVTKLEYLCRHPEAWVPMTEAARQTVLRDYDQSVLDRRLDAIYRRVASTSPHRCP